MKLEPSAEKVESFDCFPHIIRHPHRQFRDCCIRRWDLRAEEAEVFIQGSLSTAVAKMSGMVMLVYSITMFSYVADFDRLRAASHDPPLR